MTKPRQRRDRGRSYVAGTSQAAFEKSCPNSADDGDFIAHTITFWQPFSGRQLTHEDGRQIAENVAGFFSILQEWDRAEHTAEKADASGRPERPNETPAIATKIEDSTHELVPTDSVEVSAV